MTEVKLCKDCIHYHRDHAYRSDYCTGPHIYPDVVRGQPAMELPGARYSGGNGLRSDVEPCGETEASHWRARSEVLINLGSVSGKKPSLWSTLFGKKKAGKD
jgi:hypothetical protein